MTPFEKFVSIFLKATGLNFLLNGMSVGNHRGFIGFLIQSAVGAGWLVFSVGNLIRRTASAGVGIESSIGALILSVLATLLLMYSVNRRMENWVKATDKEDWGEPTKKEEL